MAVHSHRGWNRHEHHRHDHLAVAIVNAYHWCCDAVELLLLDHYGVHVVGDDDRHDGTKCGTDGPALYPGPPPCPENGPDGSSGHPYCCFCEWLSTNLAGIQPGCNRLAMVARTGWPDARHDDVDYEQRVVMIISDGRRHLSILATEKHLFETLPFTS
jgi:hypothetical protein